MAWCKGPFALRKWSEKDLLQTRLHFSVPVHLRLCKIWVTSLSFAFPDVSVSLTKQILMHGEPNNTGEALCWALEVPSHLDISFAHSCIYRTLKKDTNKETWSLIPCDHRTSGSEEAGGSGGRESIETPERP